MKRMLLSATFLAVFSSFAQKDKQFVTISSFEEKPKELQFMTLELPIWHLTGSMVNFSIYDLKSTFSFAGAGPINGGASYNWKLGDRILPETFENMGSVNRDMIMSKYEAKGAQSLDLWGTYFFDGDLVPTEESVRLKQVGNVIYVTNVTTNQYVRKGINFGYSQGFTWYNTNNVEMQLLEPTSGVVSSISSQSASTIQDYKILKAGLTISKAVNVKVHVDEYGDRKAAHMEVNQFNVLFAVQNDFDDVLVGSYNTNLNRLDFTEYQFSEDNKKLPIGFEWKHKAYGKGWWSYEYGVGYYPGMLKKINLGVNFGISFQIDMMKNKSL